MGEKRVKIELVVWQKNGEKNKKNKKNGISKTISKWKKWRRTENQRS